MPEVQVDNVTVISASNSSSATKTAKFLEELRQTTGINLAEAINSIGGNSNANLVPSKTIKPAPVSQPKKKAVGCEASLATDRLCHSSVVNESVVKRVILRWPF